MLLDIPLGNGPGACPDCRMIRLRIWDSTLSAEGGGVTWLSAPVADVARRDISAQFTPTLYENSRLRSAISSNRLPLTCPGYLDDDIHMAISEALVLSPLLYSTFLSCEWISRPGMDTVCLHA